MRPRARGHEAKHRDTVLVQAVPKSFGCQRELSNIQHHYDSSSTVMSGLCYRRGCCKDQHYRNIILKQYTMARQRCKIYFSPCLVPGSEDSAMAAQAGSSNRKPRVATSRTNKATVPWARPLICGTWASRARKICNLFESIMAKETYSDEAGPRSIWQARSAGLSQD